AHTRSSRVKTRAFPIAFAGMVAKTVASPAPTSSSSAVCTSRCTYSESQFMDMPRHTLARFSRAIQLGKAFGRLGKLDSLFGQGRFQSLNDFLGGAAAERFVGELPFLGSDVLRQPFVLFLQPRALRAHVHRFRVDNAH